MRKKKRFSIGISILGIIFLIFNMYMDKRRLEKCNIKEKLLIKDRATLDTYEQWLEAFINTQRICDYLLNNNYQSVAIYGFGRLGKQLYKDLLLSKISVAYIIDLSLRHDKKSNDPILFFHPEEELPETDLIIVTVPSEAKAIVNQLKGKVECPVKSFNDLLFVM